jgi:hypothetical protein
MGDDIAAKPSHKAAMVKIAQPQKTSFAAGYF